MPGRPEAGGGGVRAVAGGGPARRDFTVNAIAARLPSLEIVDPFGGMRDLKARVLRTPGSPEDSFRDDALRMLRAARFAAQLGFTVVPEVQAAMTAMAGRRGAGGHRVQEHHCGGAYGEHRDGQGPSVERVLADLPDDHENEDCVDHVHVDAHAIYGAAGHPAGASAHGWQ